jgi:signal peptidase I
MTRMRQWHANWNAMKARLKQRSIWAFRLVDFIETIVVALAVALMIPTFQIRDRLIVNRFIYRFTEPNRGDIIVFKSTTDDKDYVKRCIGLPGETVEMKNGYVYINGKLLVLSGVDIQRDRTNFGPMVVPQSSYFVLGDNRGNSRDSRYWGVVPKAHLMGKSLFTFWPISQMRVLR